MMTFRHGPYDLRSTISRLTLFYTPPRVRVRSYMTIFLRHEIFMNNTDKGQALGKCELRHLCYNESHIVLYPIILANDKVHAYINKTCPTHIRRK